MDAPGMPMPSSEPQPHSTDTPFVFPPLPSADVFTPHSRDSFGRRPSPDISGSRTPLSAYRSLIDDASSSASVSGGLTTEHRLHVGPFVRQRGRVGVVEEEESEMASVSGLGTAGTEMMVDDDPSEWDGVDLPPDLPAPRQTTTRFHWDIPDPKTIFRGLVFGLADQAQVDAVGCRWECESWVGEYGKETDWNLMAKVGREVRNAGGSWNFGNLEGIQADILVVPAFVFSNTQHPPSSSESSTSKARTRLRPLQTVVPADWVFACVAAKAIIGVGVWAEEAGGTTAETEAAARALVDLSE